MAAAKKAAKAAKKSPGKSLVAWEERLANEAQIAVKTEESVGGGGRFISTKGGRLTYEGAEIPGNKMNVVVVDHIIEYVYYGDRYDSENPQSPLAFAFGRDEDDMRWHDNSIPEYAGELCKDSDILEWGSADTGKGKAAKQMRRLAVIPEDQLDNIEEADVAYIKVPVTSVKGWAGYVRQIGGTLSRPPLGVITEISLVPDSKTQFKMQFKLVETIDDADTFEALFAKKDVVATEIDFPYAPYDAEQEEKPKRQQGAGRKAGVQRKVAPQRGPQRSAGRAQERAEQAPARNAARGGGKAAKAAQGGKRKY